MSLKCYSRDKSLFWKKKDKFTGQFHLTYVHRFVRKKTTVRYLI